MRRRRRFPALVLVSPPRVLLSWGPSWTPGLRRSGPAVAPGAAVRADRGGVVEEAAVAGGECPPNPSPMFCVVSGVDSGLARWCRSGLFQ
ncbi:unnamed protein product, partial [Tetraodon nigroviridis]